MESKFNTNYTKEPLWLQEMYGSSDTGIPGIFNFKGARKRSIGPFQLKYSSLGDKTREYMGENTIQNVRKKLFDPMSSFNVAVRYLAEQVPQLRNYSKKEGERQNMTRENYMKYLPYMISQQGWVRNTDEKNLRRDSENPQNVGFFDPEPTILGQGRNAYIEGIRNYANQLLDFFPSSIGSTPTAIETRRIGGEAFPQANTYPLTWAGYSGTQYASGGEAFPQAQTYLPYDRKGETRPNFMFKEGGDQFGGQFDPSMIYNVMKRGGLNINPKKKRGGSLSGMEFKDYLMKNGGLMKFQDKNSQPGVSSDRLPGEADDEYFMRTNNQIPGPNGFGTATGTTTNTGATANAGTTSTQSTATNTGTSGAATNVTTTPIVQQSPYATNNDYSNNTSQNKVIDTGGGRSSTSPYTNFDYSKYANLIKNQQVAAGIGAHIRKNPLLNALTMPYHAFNVGQQTVQGITGGAKEIGKFATNVGRIPSMIMADGGMPSLPSFQTDGGVGGDNASNPSNPNAACECKDKDGNVTKNMAPNDDGTCPPCEDPKIVGYNHVGAQQAIGSLSAMGNFLQDINAGKQQRKDEKLSAFNTLNIAQPQQNTSQMMGKALVNTTQGNLNQPNMFAQVQKPGLSMQSTSLQEGTMPKSWMNPNSPLQPINARIGGTMFESGGEYDLDIDTVRELIKAGWDVELI
jgi:hypothetical protein